MTCFCFASEAAGSGTGMPQVKLEREIERSLRPPRRKLSTSFLRLSGVIASVPLSMQFDQRLLKLAQLEEEVLFGDGLEQAAAVRAGRARGRIDEGFVGDAVGAGVGVEVDVAALVERREELLHAALWRGSVVRM